MKLLYKPENPNKSTKGCYTPTESINYYDFEKVSNEAQIAEGWEYIIAVN